MTHSSFIRFKEAFPIDNYVARWIVGLGMIHNDLMFTKKRLRKNSRSDISEQISEMPSILKLVGSSLREAIIYLEESEKITEIREYLDTLPDHIKLHYDIFKPLYKSGEESELLQRLTNLRHITFHYSKPQKNELTKALEELKEQVVNFDGDADRLLFAETISNAIMLQSLFSREEINSLDQEKFGSSVINKVHKAFYSYIEFSKEVIKHYLKDFCS